VEYNQPQNPYAAPTTEVLMAKPESVVANFIPNGRSTPTGRAIAWIMSAWRLFTLSPLIWVVNVVLYMILRFVAGWMPLVGLLLGPALFGFFIGALMLSAHKQFDGEPIEVADVFAGFKAPQAKPLLILGLLNMAASLALMVVIGVLIFVVFGVSGAVGIMLSGDTNAIATMIASAGLGVVLVSLITIALIVPVYMAFWFAPALVAINGMSPVAAISQSFVGCLKNFLPFLFYGVIFLVLIVVGSIPFLLGLLIVVPLILISTYTAYRDIYLGDDGQRV
jgi:uncharacterized membrane protein